jgi:hypothetical protein
VTGITRIAKESFFSGLNNVETHSILGKTYGEFFGFTQEEVKDFWPSQIPFDGVQTWYNGYKIGKFQVYNPWSIINCIKNGGELVPYWINTSGNELLGDLLKNSTFQTRQELEQLLKGEAVEKTLDESLVFSDLGYSGGALWTLFVHAGYLTPESLKRTHDGDFEANLRIPNEEIKVVYAKMVQRWFFEATSDVQEYKNFIGSLNKGDVKSFVAKIRSYLSRSGSYFDFSAHTPEQVFHAFMLGLFVGFEQNYHIKSNIEAGLGRCDIVFIPKNAATHKGIILEFKTCKTEEEMGTTAESAFEQIRRKRYKDALKDVAEVLCIGLAFCGKNVESYSAFLYNDPF